MLRVVYDAKVLKETEVELSRGSLKSGAISFIEEADVLAVQSETAFGSKQREKGRRNTCSGSLRGIDPSSTLSCLWRHSRILKVHQIKRGLSVAPHLCVRFTKPKMLGIISKFPIVCKRPGSARVTLTRSFQMLFRIFDMEMR